MNGLLGRLNNNESTDVDSSNVDAVSFAENMDISKQEDVFNMQSILSNLGIVDYEGKNLKSDGKLGKRTLSAMRVLQDLGYSGENLLNPEESSDYESDKKPSGPDNPWAQLSYRNSQENRKSTMMRNDGNSPNSIMKLLFGNAGEKSKQTY